MANTEVTQVNKLVFSLLLLAAALGACSAGTITVPTPECSATFESGPDGERITAPSYSVLGSPGDPALLFTEICVILPPDADPYSVAVNLINAHVVNLSGSRDIAPSPPMVAVVDGVQIEDWGTGKQIDNGRNLLVYQKDAFFPAETVQVVEVGSLRGWRIARLRFFPYNYNPVSGRLAFTSGGEIAITYSTPKIATMSSAAANSDSVMSDKLRDLTANYSQAKLWYARPSGTFRALEAQPSTTSTGYLILTTQAIVNGSSKLQGFINHKINRGFNVILATEAQWGGGTGDVAANRIRAYLASHYISAGIRYVLLIGDPTPTSGTVPMKMLWPRKNVGTYPEAPSDYFYADLTGNWDRDGDGYYGEQDNDFGTGGIDRFPEVIVGRIPFYGSFTDLDSILQKIIDYEAGGIGGSWVRSVLLSAKPSDASTPGYQFCEAIKTDAAQAAGFGVTRVYEQTYGLNPSPDYTPCSYANVLSAWQRHAGFHFWWTHGNETAAADIFTSANVQYLDDSYPSFTFQVSCMNAYPEVTNNLAYSLLRRGAIATDAATRVSWYYPGQVVFTNTDSNAGMGYIYALKLVRDHETCGDAHFDMMTQVPNGIWANHCVFNLYGDPSLAYAAGPAITHVPLTDTDFTTGTYAVCADISSSAPLSGPPVVKWNTDGGSAFSTVSMTLVSGITYRGDIPAQPMGTTFHYYIQAVDQQGQTGTSPSEAPNELYSFRIRPDTAPPAIQHTPLTDTGDRTGPYVVRATITDDLGIYAAKLYYSKNGSADTILPMQPVGGNVFEAQIPGNTAPGDVFTYYIIATDASAARKTTRSPGEPGRCSFGIMGQTSVAVYNCATNPTYFTGGNSNAYSQVADILNSDPLKRFVVTVVTNLSTASLAGKNTLVLPDNAVLTADMASVSSWFAPGRVIVALDSSACYGAYTGWMWPSAVGTNGYMSCWDTNSDYSQQIWLSDSITNGYTVGQVIDARMYETQFFTDKLPADAKALAGKQGDPSRCYAAYRDVPGRGRFVVLGPYVSPCTTEYTLLRNACITPPSDRHVRLTSPAGGETFSAGQSVTITYETLGAWSSSDRVKLEYCTGFDTQWRGIPGAESLVYSVRSFAWNTAGLPGSHNYKVRATVVGTSIFDETDSTFSIIPTIGIADAKALPDGYVVKLAGKIVTCSVGAFDYIQELDKPVGIRISTAQALTRLAAVDVTGSLTTIGGERVIYAEASQMLGPAQQLGPFAMNNKALGGGRLGLQPPLWEYRIVKTGETSWVRQFLQCGGANNVGLFVRIVGKVTYVGTEYIYVDDGSRCDDDSGHLGVRVMSGSIAKPALNKVVVVNGISSVFFSQGNPFRALVLPSADDWTIVH